MDNVIDGEVVPADHQLATRPSGNLASLYTEGSPLARAIDQLEVDLGGRAALLEMLMGLEDGDDRRNYVIGLIADPSSDTRKLSQLCRTGGIALGELLAVSKEGILTTAVIKALKHVAAKLPAVVEDVMLRAAPHTIACAACAGTGSVSATKPDDPPTPCETCRGTGCETILPDLERQKLALDLANLLPKKSPMIAIDARKQTVNAATSLADLVKATDATALRPPRQVASAAATLPAEEPAHDAPDPSDGDTIGS